MQLDLERGRIEPGFSGSGAWAEPAAGSSEQAAPGVIGLLVAVGEPDADGLQSAMLIPTRTLFAAWPALDRHWQPRNPYKGLAAFTAADRLDFFGRDALTNELAARVSDSARRLTLLLGPSGSGKSSLLGAGLLPTLTEPATAAGPAAIPWRVLQLRPGTDPFDALASSLLAAQQAERATAGESALTLGQQTDEHRRLQALLLRPTDGAQDLLRQFLTGQGDGARLLLLVDQFEELFTNVPTEQARAFCDLLDALLATGLPLHLLLAMRADFLGAALEGPARPFVAPQHQLQIAPLDGEARRAAIEAPAERAGVRFAPGLAETMLAELADQPGRLPLLQFALAALWPHQHGRQIDDTALTAIGGVRQALANYADGVIDRLSEADRGRARRILVQLVRPPEQADADGVRQVASLRNIAKADLDLLPALAASRLVVTSAGAEIDTANDAATDTATSETPANGAATSQPADPTAEPPAGRAEIAHEALIREWPRLRTWVAEDRAFRLWQEGLRSRMADWQGHGKAPGYLLTGPALAEAEGQLAARRTELADDDSAFIEASRHRARRNRQLTITGLASVMLVLAGLAAVAGWQWRLARQQEQAAVAAAEHATQARDEAEKLVSYITFDLRDKLKPFGRLDLLSDTYQRVHDYYQRLGIEGQGAVIIRRRAVNYIDQADALLARGDLKGAEDNYAEASMLFAQLADAEPDNPNWQRDLSASLNKLGDLKAAQGDLAGALAAYDQSLEIRERLAASDPSNARWQRDLVVSHWKLAEVSPDDAAAGHLRAALTVLEAMAAAGILAPTDAGLPDMIRERLGELE